MVRKEFIKLENELLDKYNKNENLLVGDYLYLREQLEKNKIILIDNLSVKNIVNQIDELLKKEIKDEVIF